MRNWSNLTIAEVAKSYRNGDLSPLHLIENIFTRIREHEPTINAFITLLEEDALRQAREAERRFQEGEVLPILYGIPYTLKDLYDTKGVRTTCGSEILKQHIPKKDATLVKQLTDMGAILIGKTNMLEFAYGIVHPAYGQTNNPYQPSKTAGGSSGGSAAAVALGLGLFSLGSDTGGSIRIPASYCGIAGLKPSYGLLSLDGVFPLSPTLDHAGPLAKSSEDLLLLLKELTKKQPDLNGQEKRVVGVVAFEQLTGVQEEVLIVYKHALHKIVSLGWETKEVDLNDLPKTEELVMNLLLPEAALVHEKWLSRKKDYAELTYVQLERGMTHRSIDYLKALQERERARKEVDTVLSKVDVLLMPTVPYPAPDEDPALEVDDEMMFTGLFNVTGHPAVSIHAGLSTEQLPIGLQLVGKRNEDVSLLEMAVVVEKLLRRVEE